MEISVIIIQHFLIRPELIYTIFKCINSISRNHMIGQTVPYRNYSICEIKFP